MAMWNPWRGCHRYSEGCRFCYIHKGDAKRGIDTDKVVKTDNFYGPVLRNAKGEYRIKPGSTVYVCFSSDFLIEDADCWRDDCWRMIKERSDVDFLFLTKRIDRFWDCVPVDWGEGYPNVTVGCTVENQTRCDERLRIFDSLPIRHKNIICQPLIERVDISGHLKGVELVVVGGESDNNGRPMDYAWVMDIRQQCVQAGVAFEFRQCATHFIKDGREYLINVRQLCAQAKKANINTGGSEK